MLSETRPAKVGQWTEPALRVLRERYLLRKEGEVVETGAEAEVIEVAEAEAEAIEVAEGEDRKITG